MKSDPDRSVVNTSTFDGSSSFGIIGEVADCAGKLCGVAMLDALATSPAAPAAAPFKNLRRSTESFFAIAGFTFEEGCSLSDGNSYSINVYHKLMIAGRRIAFARHRRDDTIFVQFPESPDQQAIA